MVNYLVNASPFLEPCFQMAGAVGKRLICSHRMKNASAMSTYKEKLSRVEEYMAVRKAKQESFENHCYSNLAKLKTREEVIQELMASIIYNQKGIICFNKPYGLRVKPFKEKPAVHKPHHIPTSYGYDNSLSMETCLKEDLTSLLEQDSLIITKSCERFNTGICAVSINKKVENGITTSFKRSSAQNETPYTFLAVALGIPTSDDAEIVRLGYKLNVVDQAMGIKSPCIVQTFSRIKVKNQLVKPVYAQCTTLSSNPELNVSLIRISISTRLWHFARVYATHKGAAVLGDNLHSHRVHRLFDKAVNTSSLGFMESGEPQKIPESVSKKLQLQKGLLRLVPIHLHLHRLMIKNYFRMGDITVTAPIPSHFAWTLDQLGLEFKDDLENGNQ